MGCSASNAQSGFEHNGSSHGVEVKVMSHYKVLLDKESVRGEGTSSVCRKGTDTRTGQMVAIKSYKSASGSGGALLLRFSRQVTVLQDLQKPFTPVEDPNLRHPFFDKASPAHLFMVLLDYSKTTAGAACIPGPDLDGKYYLITELAEYSLKDFLALQREEGHVLQLDTVRSMTRAILRVAAGLHAKALVHIDFKPENLMMFGGYLKLIDVDGCIRIGSCVRIQDSSVSFSPLYCSPQWAEFLVNDSQKMLVEPALDAWSIGMTLAELVAPASIMKSRYKDFLHEAGHHNEAGFLFMDWLRNISAVSLSKEVREFNVDFTDMLEGWLLVPDDKKRRSCAQCLDHRFLDVLKKSTGSSGMPTHGSSGMPTEGVRIRRNSKFSLGPDTEWSHKGRLWRFTGQGDFEDRKNWVEHDTWLSGQGSLCYFSNKAHKQVVLIGVASMCSASVKLSSTAHARGSLFEIAYKDANDCDLVMKFASDLPSDAKEWVDKFQCEIDMTEAMTAASIRLGDEVTELRACVLSVKNRRLSVRSQDEEGQINPFKPVFKEKLWKLIADGERRRPFDWREREMWVAQNGCLVYSSKKEGKPLVYYTAEDLANATCEIASTEECCKPFPFTVTLKPTPDGLEFAPGDFAANSEDLRRRWIQALRMDMECLQPPLGPQTSVESEPAAGPAERVKKIIWL